MGFNSAFKELNLNLLLGRIRLGKFTPLKFAKQCPLVLKVKVCWRPNTASVTGEITKWSEVDCLSKRQMKEVWILFVCLIVQLAAMQIKVNLSLSTL